MSRMIAGFLFVVVVPIVVLVMIAPAQLETSCQVSGMQGTACTFTNPGKSGPLPGKTCVTIALLKSKEGESNALWDKSDMGRVGEILRSGSVCSGMVWSGSTTTVTTTSFMRDPMRFCGGFANCEMHVEEVR